MPRHILSTDICSKVGIVFEQDNVEHGTLGEYAGRSILLLRNCDSKAMFCNLKLTDMETCYKVFRTDLLKSIPIRSDRFGFEPEIVMKCAKRKLRIYEVPISYHGRTYEEGKKIGWKDGVTALWTIFKYRFTD